MVLSRRVPALLLLALLLLAALPLGAVSAAPRAAGGSSLAAGEVLTAGQALVSPSGRYRLGMGADGDVTLEERADRLRPTVLSQLVAAGPPGSQLTLQTDANLVLYGPGGTVRTDWATSGSGAQQLVVQDDGNLVLYAAAGRVVLDFATGRTSYLLPGGLLLAGDVLVSPDGSTRLVMQGDGNLVAYRGAGVVFDAGTSGHPGAAAVLQDDGNLVVYDAGSPLRALFATATSGPDADVTELDVQTGQVSVVAQAGTTTALWGSAWGTDTVAPGQVLYAGDRRTSAGGGCVLLAQGDGNLVQYCAGRAVWSTGTSGPLFAVMDPGGAFTLYTSGDTPAFSTRTGTPGSRLVTQSDRNVVVYTPAGRAVFSAL